MLDCGVIVNLAHNEASGEVKTQKDDPHGWARVLMSTFKPM